MPVVDVEYSAKSTPSPPFRVSGPAPPMMLSLPSPPVIWSAASVPTIVPLPLMTATCLALRMNVPPLSVRLAAVSFHVLSGGSGRRATAAGAHSEVTET